MSYKFRIFTICFSVITLTALAVLFVNQTANPYQHNYTNYKPGQFSEVDKAISLAKLAYQQEKNDKKDFSNGPCIDNDLMKDWVADTVHTPRQPIDNEPQNQCSNYLSGKAHHFVELDVDGHLVRTQ